MFRSQWQLSCTVGLVALLSAGAANAQSPGQIDKLQAQINELQRQIAALKGQVKATEKRVATAPPPVYTKAPYREPTAIVEMSPNNRPSICTPDELNCIALTGRLHLDVGGYSYHPNSALTAPHDLDSGVNARRARLGVVGKFMGDWQYTFIYDFGGSSDGGLGASAGNGGAPTSGIENAYVSYTGLKPFAIEGGYMDVPWTLDEATSSNDIMFMERSSSQVIATSLGGGDFRSAIGIRGNTDRLWGGVYLTGPTSGASHSWPASEQDALLTRVSYQVLQDKDYSFHIGGNALWLLHNAGAAGGLPATLTLSDRPELRIDPTAILSTGALAGVDGAQVYGAEAAAGVGSFFVQGEYFHYDIDRMFGAPSLSFNGGYVEASYTLTGEARKYSPGSGAYSSITPAHPFSRDGSGWGAWEIAGRYSTIDLNDNSNSLAGLAAIGGLPFGVSGGQQTVYTVGLNWYVNRNVRLMFDYLHGEIDNKFTAAAPGVDVGAKFDALAMRTQVAF